MARTTASGLPAEVHGPALSDLDRSLYSMIAGAARKYSDETALMSLAQSSECFPDSGPRAPNVIIGDTVRWTYKELIKKVELLAGALLRRGCNKGSIVVVLLWNSAEWVLYFWASALLKATFVPLDPELLEGYANIAYYFYMMDPDALVVPTELDAQILQMQAPDILRKIPCKIVCATTSSDPGPHWHTMRDLLFFATPLPSPLRGKYKELGRETGIEADVSLVVFTSEPQDLPKGCPLTAANLWSQTNRFCEPRFLDETHKCIILTSYHQLCSINSMLRAWREGAAVVISSPKYDAEAVLTALGIGCTHIVAEPAMVQDLVSHPLFHSRPVSTCLEQIQIGGSILSREDISNCRQLKPRIITHWYGMNEAMGLVNWAVEDFVTGDIDYEGSGKVLPGAMLRICAPATHVPLTRNQTGEIHIGGTSVISAYLGNDSSELFYADHRGKWFVTGDQGYLDLNGALHLLGRSKDFILRNGENVSVPRIRSCLNLFPNITVEIVAVPDAEAGMVPIAIINGMEVSKDIRQHLVDYVLMQLGPEHTPTEILTLQELGYGDFLKAGSRKVQQATLELAVLSHMESRKEGSSLATHGETARELLQIWIRLLRISENETLPPGSIWELADSMTLLRFTSEVWRIFGKNFSMKDFLKKDTIAEQAQFIDSLADQISAKDVPGSSEDSLKDRCFDSFNPTIRKQIAVVCNETLAELGLTWRDVEDVFPVPDSLAPMAAESRPQSNRTQFMFGVEKQYAPCLRAALEKTLGRHPVLRTVPIKFDYYPQEPDLYLAVLKPTAKLYRLMVEEKSMTVKVGRDDNFMQRFALDDGYSSFSASLMFSALIVHIKHTEKTILVLTLKNCVFDSLSITQFMEELDHSIKDPYSQLPPMTPYSAFATHYFANRKCTSADSSLRFQASRLHGIFRKEASFWPPQRAPGFFIGRSDGWRGPSWQKLSRYTKLGRNSSGSGRHRPVPSGQLGIEVHKPLEHLPILVCDHGIQRSMVIKTALAILNVHLSNTDTAVFANHDAARTWPFLAGQSHDHFAALISLAGPTLSTTTINSIQINEKETILEMLQRVQEEQELLSEHAHVPFKRLLDDLGEEDKTTITNLRVRQVLIWDPVMLQMELMAQNKGLHTKELGDQQWPPSRENLKLRNADATVTLAGPTTPKTPRSFSLPTALAPSQKEPHSPASSNTMPSIAAILPISYDQGAPSTLSSTESCESKTDSLSIMPTPLQSSPNTLKVISGPEPATKLSLPKSGPEAEPATHTRPFLTIQFLARRDWLDVGLVWRCGIVVLDNAKGPELVVNVMWDDAQLSTDVMRKATEKLVGLVKWMTQPGNETKAVKKALIELEKMEVEEVHTPEVVSKKPGNSDTPTKSKNPFSGFAAVSAAGGMGVLGI